LLCFGNIPSSGSVLGGRQLTLDERPSGQNPATRTASTMKPMPSGAPKVFDPGQSGERRLEIGEW
jgi:hypothetical protein